MAGQDPGKELFENFPRRNALAGELIKIFPTCLANVYKFLTKIGKFPAMARKKSF